MDATEVMASLKSGKLGLSQEEAKRRLVEFGPNELEEKERISPLTIFLGQFKSFLIIILLAATVVSAVIGETVDAAVIAAIVILACVLGFIQEYRAERAVEALKRMAALMASVIREGGEIKIPAREVVPGDIVLLRSGDRISSDLRLIKVIDLKADEAPLTGESVPVKKTIKAIPGKVPLGDRKNMAYMGTAVSYGKGEGIVVATGMATEFGKIAEMLQQVKKERTPLQVSLDKLGKWIGAITIAVCLLVTTLGIIRGYAILEMFIWGVALAVAAVPEALPAVVTVCLALGVRRMVRHHAIVRKLSAVETLGCTTVICSDKTGTLTQDEMTVRKIYVNGQTIDVTGVGYEPSGQFYLDGKALYLNNDPHLKKLLHICCLCNDAGLNSVNGVWQIKGDPTEGALIVFAAKAGIWRSELSSQFPRVNEVPFSSERKRMTTIHQTPQGKVAYTKGAPEIIIDSCAHILTDSQERKLNSKYRDHILEVAHEMAGGALRVLGMAYKPLSEVIQSAEDAERHMVFVGLTGMIDPPREEVKNAIKLCEQAGIRAVMITGDHKLTAMAVANELDLLKRGMAISGAELDKLSDEQFKNIVGQVEVYARVSPSHKLRIVEALFNRGQIVAMTGDGINDAPALKRADIGIAMGITGTDVTKEAADMVLTDDNFASIVAAVEEGRNIFKNIKNFFTYGLSCHIGEVLIMLIAMLVGLPIPLIAAQILWVNLITDGLPPMALSVEPLGPGMMRELPRGRKEGFFAKPTLYYGFGVAILITCQTLAVFLWALNTEGLIKAQTMAFTMIVMSEMLNAFNCRSDKYSIFKLGFFTNKPLIYAVISTVLLQLAVIYIPFFQKAFHTTSLSLTDWVIILSVASSTLLVVEITKFVRAWRNGRVQQKS